MMFVRYMLLWSICFLIASCQEEEREFINPDTVDTIPQTSLLSTLLKNVVTHDGSFDDRVDGGNCYSINLPYDIVLNGHQYRIDSPEDYTQISYKDKVSIVFPITITFYNYKEQLVDDQKTLDRIATNCSTTDDDIECVDFVYPMSFSVFYPATNTFETVEILHDQQVYTFMDVLEEDVAIAIQYPIALQLHTGVQTKAAHNTDLLNGILKHGMSCDEND